MSNHQSGERTGGCLCGAIRYQVSGAPGSVSHCHCRICQKANGTPFVTWATYPLTNYRLLHGTHRRFASSQTGKRCFCRDCGSQLVFLDEQTPDELDITVTSLDEIDLVPTCHIWTASKVPWLVFADGLPQYAHGGREEGRPD